MKRWLTFTLMLTVLMTFTKLAAEQKAANPKSPATGPTQYSQDSLRKGVPPTTPPPPPPRPFDPKGHKLMTGKVTQVNPTAKTFTVMAKGQAVTFTAANLTLPKVGEILDITYTQTPGGPMEATTTKSTKSKTGDYWLIPK
jgi:hypothetical protein